MEIKYKNIYYPSGGILLWIVIFLELLTFGIALIAMVYKGKSEPDLFHESRLALNITLGTINTILLLTSGFFMALSAKEARTLGKHALRKFLPTTILFGGLFLILKGREYHEKISAGFGMGRNSFFDYYWMLKNFNVIVYFGAYWK